MSRIGDALRGFARGWNGPAKASPASEPVSAPVGSAPANPASDASSVWATQRALTNPSIQDVPQDWIRSLMGPGWPMIPYAATGQRGALAETEPRSYQYIPNVNATLSPRIAYGLTPFSQLQYWGENVPEAALCRRLLVEEMKNFVPQIVNKDGEVVQKAEVVLERDRKGRPLRDERGNLIKTFTGRNLGCLPGFEWMTTCPTPQRRRLTKSGGRMAIVGQHYGRFKYETVDARGRVTKETDSEVTTADVAWEVERPDRKNAFPLWLSRFIYNVLVYDAGCFYRVRDEDGQIIGMRVIDGSTIFTIIDERGEAPQPPAPAFTQIIFGQPRQWYTTLQLWYNPRQIRSNSPYGIAFTEDAMAPVMFLDQLWQYEMAEFTQGTSPRAFLKAPPTWTMEQCIQTEVLMNARMAGNAFERARIRIVPDGFDMLDVKPHVWPEPSYKAARDALALAAGVHPSELGQMQGHGLSGSKGGQEKGEDSHARMGIGPLKEYIESPFNDVLLECGKEGFTFVLGSLDVEIDTKAEEEKWMLRWSQGLITRDAALQGLGETPVNGPAGQAYLLPTGKDAQTIGEDGNETLDANGQPKPKPQPAPPGGPNGPVPANDRPEPGQAAVRPQAVPEQKATKYQIEQHSGAMVAVFIPLAAARELHQLTVGAGLPDAASVELPEDMHVTLAFFPELPDAAKALACVQAACMGGEPLTGKIQGYGIFRNQESDVLWAGLDCPALPALRQRVCEALDRAGIVYGQDHGFTPHITLAYLPRGTDVPDALASHSFNMPVKINDVALAHGPSRRFVSLAKFNNLGLNGHTEEFERAWKVEALSKHCGVCPDDDAYFGAPVSRDTTVLFPRQGANDTEIVAMSPSGLESRPALWKPQGGEEDRLVEAVGGPLYLRDEAVYLLDRALDFYLVPVCYNAVIDDEPGTVVHYVRGNEPAVDVALYKPYWIERAAALDYISGQLDRKSHNWITYPREPESGPTITDDLDRPILIDSHMSFATRDLPVQSAFVDAWDAGIFSDEILGCLARCLGDVVWTDIRLLVGGRATDLALARLQALIACRCIPVRQPSLP